MKIPGAGERENRLRRWVSTPEAYRGIWKFTLLCEKDRKGDPLGHAPNAPSMIRARHVAFGNDVLERCRSASAFALIRSEDELRPIRREQRTDTETGQRRDSQFFQAASITLPP